MDTELFLQSGAIISLDSERLLIGWGRRIWIRAPLAMSFYFPDFFLEDKKPWFVHEHQEVISLDSLQNLLDQVTNEPLTLDFENSSFEFFSTQFLKLKKEISEGHLEKAVPYIFTNAQGKSSKKNLTWRLSHLLEYAQKLPVFAYGFWDSEEGILGATPERLFALEKENLVKSVALAGTKRMHEGDLATDPKERKEHQLVIEGVKKALFPFGKVKVGNTEVVSYSAIKHLFTPISLIAEEKLEFDQLVQALHPTPALGAFPKEAGKREWLLDYQTKLPRKRFGAPVGYWREDAGQCYVAIRNVQWQDDKWQIGAGCGVVLESELEKEWNELNLKIDATRQILAI